MDNAAAQSEKPSTVIGAGVTVRGDIEGPTDLHVQGKVLGNVSVHGFILEDEGVIEGSVAAAAVMISGQVTGAVEAKAVHVKASGRIDGDVTYAILQVDAGARMSGRLMVSESADLGVAKTVEAGARGRKPRSDLEESGQELVRMAARLRRASE